MENLSRRMFLIGTAAAVSAAACAPAAQVLALEGGLGEIVVPVHYKIRRLAGLAVLAGSRSMRVSVRRAGSEVLIMKWVVGAYGSFHYRTIRDCDQIVFLSTGSSGALQLDFENIGTSVGPGRDTPSIVSIDVFDTDENGVVTEAVERYECPPGRLLDRVEYDADPDDEDEDDELDGEYDD